MKFKILFAVLFLTTSFAYAEPTYTKESGSVLAVEEVKTIRKSYNLSELKGRKAQVEEQLAEVNALIAEAEKLGVVEE